MSEDIKKKIAKETIRNNKRKKKDEDKLPIYNKKVKNLIPSRTQIRIKNVSKTKVPTTTSPKTQVGKMKPNLPKTTSPKNQVAKVPKSTSPKNKLKK